MAKQGADGWCLKMPNGNLLVATFAQTKEDCWGKSFAWVWEPSQNAAKLHGYEMVPVRLVTHVTPVEVAHLCSSRSCCEW